MMGFGLRPAFQGGGILTFISRASTATYIDSNGVLQTAGVNVPRYQGGALLAEAAATNLTLNSNGFTSAGWLNSLGSILQNAVGPSSAANEAWTLTDSSTSLAEFLLQDISLTAGQVVTRQLFVKKTIGPQPAYPVIDFDTTGYIGLATIDTTNGITTVWSSYSGFSLLTTSATCVSAGSFWLVSLTITAATAGTYEMVFYPAAAAVANQSSGVLNTSLTGSAVVADAQLETGPAPTSYIPTTSAPATRAADITGFV